MFSQIRDTEFTFCRLGHASGWDGGDLAVKKGALAIRRIFSLVDMITKPKFSNCPNIFKIGLVR